MKLYIKLNTICLLLFFFFSVKGNAQQDPEYTQYMYNTMTVNPAYTGSPGFFEAILQHRSQWVGIDGAPQTEAFAIHSPLLNEKVGLGLNAINDKLGPSNELLLEANFSYTLNLSFDHKLAFGLKAGASILNIDWSKGRYYDASDAYLNTNIDNKFNPTLGAGIYFYTERYYVGLSVPSFIRSDYYDDIKESVLSDRLHYYLIAGYVFRISDNFKFKPAVLVKAVSGAPLSADFSANFLLLEKLTLGTSYRLDDSVSALAGFQVNKNFFVGYSFDYTLTKLNKYNDGSHEIILRFQLAPKEKRIRSPRFF